MKRPGWFLIGAVFVALAQIATLTWMIAGRAAILRDGPEIVLAVQPIDPRDFLRGDYIRFNYDISRIDRSLFQGEDLEKLMPGATIFLQMSANADGIWQPVRAAIKSPADEEVPQGDVILRGNLRHMIGEGAVAINYGIERLYVPQGEGSPFEAPDMAEDLRVHVAIGSDGSAQIKSLHDGDQMFFAEPLF